MNPGQTTNPLASITLLVSSKILVLILAIFPSFIPTSPWYQGLPAPSIILPFFIIIS